jgi:hypothetical protein
MPALPATKQGWVYITFLNQTRHDFAGACAMNDERRSLTLNVHQQFISRVEGHVTQNIRGTVHLGTEAKDLHVEAGAIAILQRYVENKLGLSCSDLIAIDRWGGWPSRYEHGG